MAKFFKDTFAVGDEVTWRDAEWQARAVEDMGQLADATFVVEKVIPVEGSYRGAAHSQHLRLVGDSDFWSGAWFRKVEP